MAARWGESVKEAAAFGKAGALQALLKKRGTKKIPEEALATAARQDFTGECARILCEAGANVNARVLQNTALIIATYRGNVNTIRVLLEHKADPHITDAQNTNALFYAAQSTGSHVTEGSVADFVEILKLFQAHGVDITTAKCLGQPLATIIVAAENDHEAITNLILAAKADVNAQSFRTGETALHYAVKNGNLAFVRRLLAAGANTRLRRTDIGRDGLPTGSLAIENVMYSGNYRVAYAILKHEKDKGINTDDYPSVPKGMIHSSAANVRSIEKMVEEYIKEGGSAFPFDNTGDNVIFNALSPETEAERQRQTNKTAEYFKHKTRRTCSGCSASHYEMKACARCKSVYYCSRACQVADWRVHKPNCIPITPTATTTTTTST